MLNEQQKDRLIALCNEIAHIIREGAYTQPTCLDAAQDCLDELRKSTKLIGEDYQD